MPAATTIAIERATEGDAEAISNLLKTHFGDGVTHKHTDVDGLKNLITKQHCVFELAIDPQLEGRVIVGVAWWYFHMPKDWSGDRKGLFEALFGPTSNDPNDFKESGFGADPATAMFGLVEERAKALGLPGAMPELREPLLVLDKVCVDKDRRKQGIAESLLKNTFGWAVLHDVKVLLTVEMVVAFRLLRRIQKVLSDVVVRRYISVPGNANGPVPVYGTLASRYGVNEPYPEGVKEIVKKPWETL